MSRSNRAAKSTLIIIIFTLGSKFLGFLKEVLIAAKFGSGIETDTFYSFISYGIVIWIFDQWHKYTFIPVISEVESKKEKR